MEEVSEGVCQLADCAEEGGDRAASSLADIATRQAALERELHQKEHDFGPEHVRLVKVLSDLGEACGQLGDFARRCDLWERASYITEREYSYASTPQAVPNALTKFAEAYGDSGDAQKRQELLERVQKVEQMEASFQASSVADQAHTLSMASSDLCAVPASTFSLTSLVTLNLSRNNLIELPPQIGELPALEALDVSRNKLFVLPPELGQLTNLHRINVFGNHLRPLKRSLPLAELAALRKLALLDLRFNDKLKEATVASVLAEHLPSVIVLLTGVAPKAPRMVTAGDRDATLLQSQLEPYSLYYLRERLSSEFGITTSTEVTRYEVMKMLLECYETRPRTVRKVQGVAPHCTDLLDLLLLELRQTAWPKQADRERPKIRAGGYIILSRPHPDGIGTKAGRLAAAKVKKYSRVFELATQIMADVDQDYAARWTAIAITYNFFGSPHIDHDNVGPFYGLALGDFQGGAICVESGPFEVVEVDTRYKLGKVDGRNPHWVAPHTGDRYSVIYYATWGEVVPKNQAVFEWPLTVPTTGEAPAEECEVGEDNLVLPPAESMGKKRQHAQIDASAI